MIRTSAEIYRIIFVGKRSAFTKVRDRARSGVKRGAEGQFILGLKVMLKEEVKGTICRMVTCEQGSCSSHRINSVTMP